MAKKATPAANIRTFNGLPLVDATMPLQILILAEDIQAGYDALKDKAVNDYTRFSSCAIAQGTKRMLNSDNMKIQRATAYIEHAGPDGVTRAYRYLYTDETEEFVRKFDAEKLPVADVMITLRPPSSGKTLEYQNMRDKKLRDEKAKGTYSPNPNRSKKQSRNHTKPQVIAETRNGSLHIQQTIAEAAAA